MNVHFIAIGGAAMHNLAIALHKKGWNVSGSDDEIFEPSRGRLAKYGLLPASDGWQPDRITPALDAIILGMHARKDNPELLKALELGLKIYSYPEFIYEETRDKTRVVIGGSHGKTTITSMIMHVLRDRGKKFDYLVGAQIEGFETMAGLEHDTTAAIIEGDEYLASPLTPVPKFHLYHPQVALISGIAWDHINVFPTFENYCEQFSVFIGKILPGGTLIYCKEDAVLREMAENYPRNDLQKLPYGVPAHVIRNGVTMVQHDGREYPLSVFGSHNLMNLEGARLACEALGIGGHDFYASATSFTGASKRLELLFRDKNTAVYKDFAHSPSKLKATIGAAKAQFPERKLIGVMELHTFSSLNKNFLAEYNASMQDADEAVVYYSPQTIAHKKLQSISKEEIAAAFGKPGLRVIDNRPEMEHYLLGLRLANATLLLMSSGNWSGIDIHAIDYAALLKA